MRVTDSAFSWTAMGHMEIKETPVFSRRLPDVMDDDEYAFLQFALVVNPQMGVVIPGTGGIRKLRWAGSGRGKRGGARIIYFAALADGQILMLYVYAKNDRGDLSETQKKALRTIVEAEYGSRTPIERRGRECHEQPMYPMPGD